jgi:hypothetical protein
MREITSRANSGGLIIGCDFHARYQQIAMVDNVTGEFTEAGGQPLYMRGCRMPRPGRGARVLTFLALSANKK